MDTLTGLLCSCRNRVFSVTRQLACWALWSRRAGGWACFTPSFLAKSLATLLPPWDRCSFRDATSPTSSPSTVCIVSSQSDRTDTGAPGPVPRGGSTAALRTEGTRQSRVLPPAAARFPDSCFPAVQGSHRGRLHGQEGKAVEAEVLPDPAQAGKCLRKRKGQTGPVRWL